VGNFSLGRLSPGTGGISAGMGKVWGTKVPLLCPAFRPWRRPVFHFCSKMLLTSDLLSSPPRRPFLIYGSTPSSAESITTKHSLAGSHSSVSVAVLDSLSAMPSLLSQYLLSCLSSQVPCVFGASDLVIHDEVPFPCLHVPSSWQPSYHAAAASLSASADDVPIPRFPSRSALNSCVCDEVLILHPFLSFLLFPCLCSPSTCRLVAGADAFLGIVNIHFLLQSCMAGPHFFCGVCKLTTCHIASRLV
jgi:hypothetical protein